MTQTALTYRTNRDLFSNHYLTNHLRDTEPWNEVDDAEVREVYNEIRDLYDEKQHRFNDDDYNEAQLERNFIRPIFEILDVSYEIEETVERNARRPDYGFFETDEAADAAFDRNNFYEEAVAVADAKRWGRKLDTRGEEKRDFENPSYQIHAYLQETPTTWAVLTNGQKWRLYYGPTSHRLDSYYEIDLPTLLQHVENNGSLEDFKDFYLFFRKDAFVEDTTGSSFLDDIYEESSVFAEALGEDLQDNIYEAIRVLAEGFLDTNDELDEGDLELIHDSSLIYLYRLIFVLYAESEGRDLLPTDNPIYRGSYSLNNLKQTVVENRDETQQHYQSWQTNLWDRLEELFVLIDQGSHGKGIPENELYIPAYNGGLFRTDPNSEDSGEAQFLANYDAGDAYLAEVIDLLTRRKADEGEGLVFVDYSSLDERHLGSIYEGLLEYKLDIADEPLTVEEGEYATAGSDGEVEVESGEVYLRTDAGERKVTGSYYTPEYVVEYIVKETLGPLVKDIRNDLLAQDPFDKEGGGQFAEDFADRIFNLKILDPAMGSGHFLVNAVDYLAREIIDAQERQDQQAVKSGHEEEISEPHTEEGELRDINWARRKVAQRCIYGVDQNPLATELAKVSLWLRTLAAEQPLAFLDHHLKTGNSLVGSDIENVLDNGASSADGQLTLEQSFARTRQQALEHVMERFQDLLSIDNETLDDIKEMEKVYEQVRRDPLYQHLLAMANVHTAGYFGQDVPSDAFERMAEALRDDTWDEIEDQDWFRSAQDIAAQREFFHWELEFPVAFYGEDGGRLEDAGFDAIIGNPPWLNAWRMTKEMPELRDAIKGLFESTELLEGHWDLFVPFTIQALNLSREGGRHSFILPNLFLTEKYAKDLRKSLLTDHSLDSILGFGEFNVFESVERQSTAYVTEVGSSESDQHNLRICTDTNPFVFDEISRVDDSTWLEAYNHQIRVDGDYVEYAVPIIEKIESKSDQLGQYLYVNVGATVSSKKSGKFTKSDVVSEEPEGNAKRFFQGSDVSRWTVDWAGEWLDYRREEMSGPRQPEMFEAEKLVIRKRTDEGGVIAAAYDDEGMYCDDTVLVCCEYEALQETDATTDFEGFKRKNGNLDLKYALALANSTLMTWLFKNKFETGGLQGSYSDVWPQSVRAFPVPQESQEVDQFREYKEKGIERLSIDREEVNELETPQEFLSALSEGIIQRQKEREEINLDLIDYLGDYSEGPALSELSPVPPEGRGDSILVKNDGESNRFKKIRATEAIVERDGDTLIINLVPYVKPQEDFEDEYDTNNYGYTELDPEPAVKFVSPNEDVAVLIEEFVPYAVSKANGFAGYRDDAIASKSLIDRLENITLPDPSGVSEELDRYRDNKERVDTLEKATQVSRNLIDDIVCDLYDLTDKEKEIVRNNLNIND